MPKNLLGRMLRLRYAFPFIVAAAAALLLVSEVSYHRASDAVQSTRQHVQARVDMRRVLQLITDAETAQRGYVLTGSDDFLQPYRTAIEALPKAREAVLAYLEETGQDDARRELSRLIEVKLSEVQTTVALRQSGSAEASRTLVESGIGMEQMEALRLLMDGLVARAADAVDASGAITLRTLAANRFGVATLMGLSVLGLYLVLKQARALEQSREAQRRFLQGERERLEEEVLQRTRDLRELARHLQSAREDERGHLARELHDELGAHLTSAKLNVARLRAKAGTQPEVTARLADLTQSLNDCIALKRRIIEDLRPSSLDNLGLQASLEILCRDMAERLSVPVETSIEPLTLGPQADLTVYRFVQEALSNIGKYAQARQVSVRLAHSTQAVEVQVADDGVGFDAAASMAGRHGLAGMRFRVESLGGRMVVHSTPGRGTTLRAELPPAPLAPA
jgi:signal transduction histidine kinase